MVTIIVIATWIVAAVAAGVGLGRVIARAEHHRESSRPDSELSEVTAH